MVAKRKHDSESNGSTGRAKRRLLSDDEARASFRDGLFDEKVLKDYTQEYADSQP